MAVIPELIGKGSFAITPNDSADLSEIARGGLFVGTGGHVKFTSADGTTDEWIVPTGGYVHVAVTKVFATVASGTIAADIHGLRV